MGRPAVYYDGDLRQDLIDTAAAEIAATDSTDISIRAIARSLGVSHSAPLNHFRDKRQLLTGVAYSGYLELRELLARAMVDLSAAPALSRLREGIEVYFRFSRSHRGHFLVMWRRDLVDWQTPGIAETYADLLRILVDTVVEAQEEGWRTSEQPAHIAMLVWSATHGLVQLWENGAIPDLLDGDFDSYARGMVDMLLAEDVG